MLRAKKKAYAAARDHHKIIATALRDLFSKETSSTVKGDSRLAIELKRRGIYCSGQMVRDVRIRYKLPTAYERKVRLFAEGK